jgi:hypothetical protein
MKFSKNVLRIGDFEKLSFFESAILDFFFLDPYENYVIEWMGLNFDVFPGFQKIPCYA